MTATLQSIAKEQAEKCVVFVDTAKEQAKLSGRDVHDELEDMMMVRLTEDNINKQRGAGAGHGFAEARDMLQTFISANQYERDPQALLKKLTALSDHIGDKAKTAKTGGSNAS